MARPAGSPTHCLHNAYPTLRGYIDHMNSYSSMGAELAVAKGHRRFSVANIVIRPLLTFIYNYFIPARLSRRTRGPAAAPVSLGVRLVEICESVGIGAQTSPATILQIETSVEA